MNEQSERKRERDESEALKTVERIRLCGYTFLCLVVIALIVWVWTS